MWRDYCLEKGIDINTPYEAWSFGDAPDKLATLVLNGKKTATSSAYDLYELDDSEPLPTAGDHSVILDSRDNAVCIIKTTRITVVPFSDVTEEHAAKEGEGDLSLRYWREVHEDFFTKEFVGYGLDFDESRRIVCEEFELVYKPLDTMSL